MIRETLNRAAIRLMAITKPEAQVTELKLTQPAPDPTAPLKQTIRLLANALGNSVGSQKETDEIIARRNYEEWMEELDAARHMGGSGPWINSDPMGFTGPRKALKESDGDGISAQGAFGDMELALQNVDWRREINYAWLQFSRWGIQQIILISRLYYLKNPIIRRLVDVCSLYVFARGVEVSSPDPDANDVIRDFFERNSAVFGQTALIEHEKRKYYDGNLFFALFTDTQDKGLTNARLMDAIEVQEVVTDPNDTDTEILFLRCWTARVFDPVKGSFTTKLQKAWYPALGYNPDSKPPTIGDAEVLWDNPVLHRKCGTVGKWVFGCPLVYPALDWAKASRKFLEACAAVKAALAQVAMTITSKGGQQALAGIKQQLETTVGTGNASWWDTNPTAVNGSIFTSGPGTQLAAFKSQGQGGDPEEVRQFKLMCCMVFGVPETFLADVSTGNLATATTLDRPTELNFLAKQESWNEDFVRLFRYVLTVAAKAPGSKFREALEKRKAAIDKLAVYESARKRMKDGRWTYEAAAKPQAGKIEIQVTFPAIREGDIPALVKAWTDAMTLGNSNGEVVGIDERAGVLGLGEALGIEQNQELVNKMYPDDEYDPNREAQKQAALDRATAITAAKPAPAAPGGQPGAKKPAIEAAIDRLSGALVKVRETWK